MLHRWFERVVVMGVVRTIGCAEPVPPEELVVRFDRTVRSTDRGWMFESVGRSKTGTLYRWSRVKDEIAIRTWVFKTDKEAQARLRETTRVLPVGSTPIDTVGDLAYISGGTESIQTYVYASAGRVYFEISAPSFPEKDLVRRLAVRIGQELTDSVLFGTTASAAMGQHVDGTLSLIGQAGRSIYRGCQLNVTALERFNRASQTCMLNLDPPIPLYAARTLSPHEITTLTALVQQGDLCGGQISGNRIPWADCCPTDGFLEALVTDCGERDCCG